MILPISCRRPAENEESIVSELNAAQGSPVDIGGYYEPTESLVSQQMRPSETFNSILDEIK